MNRPSYLCALLTLMSFLLFAMPAVACFGPKLYFGVEQDAGSDLRFALVTLYVKEKTGVEAERVLLAGKSPSAELDGERLDLVVAERGSAPALRFPDGSLLLVGKRLQEDLQFTTVLPALAKLQKILAVADWQGMVERVRGGEGALAVARSFYKQQGAL